MPLYAPPTTILAADGTVTAPSYSFASQPAIGIYRVSSSNIGISAQTEVRFGTNISIGGGTRIDWYTGGAFAAINVSIAPAGASTARIEVNNGTLTTYRDLIARQLFAGGDSTAGIASSTSLTNATNGTVTNAYTVNGGQAATTSNTGWIKIYVGTAVAWIPYWQNATP